MIYICLFVVVVVACIAVSGQGAIFVQRIKIFNLKKYWKLYGKNQKHKQIT
jgi:hypothetical protein